LAFISFACPKETNQRKGRPRRCFNPPARLNSRSGRLSENIENLFKVVPSGRLTENAVGAFEDFQIFSDSRQYWPAVWEGQRSANLAVSRDGLLNNKRNKKATGNSIIF